MQTIKKIISAAMNIDISQFSLLLLLLWILVMYGHSLTPAVLSSQESSRALLLVRQLFQSAGVEEAWLTEFIPTPAKEEDEEEVLGEGDEFGMTDDMGLGGDI